MKYMLYNVYNVVECVKLRLPILLKGYNVKTKLKYSFME